MLRSTSSQNTGKTPGWTVPQNSRKPQKRSRPWNLARPPEMTAFPRKYESPVNPRSTWNSVNSLLGVGSTVDCLLLSYSCPAKIPPAPPGYHPENSFNINLDVLENAGITSSESTLMKTQLCWAGHLSRMHDHRLDYTIRRTLDRSLQQRRTEKALQRHAKDGTQCLQH